MFFFGRFLVRARSLFLWQFRPDSSFSRLSYDSDHNRPNQTVQFWIGARKSPTLPSNSVNYDALSMNLKKNQVLLNRHYHLPTEVLKDTHSNCVSNLSTDPMNIVHWTMLSEHADGSIIFEWDTLLSHLDSRWKILRRQNVITGWLLFKQSWLSIRLNLAIEWSFMLIISKLEFQRMLNLEMAFWTNEHWLSAGKWQLTGKGPLRLSIWEPILCIGGETFARRIIVLANKISSI